MRFNFGKGIFERTTAVARSGFAFNKTGTMVKTVKASGSLVFTGLPTNGQQITLDDGVNPALAFEFDDGTAATGTLTLSGVPADTGTSELSDGATTKVFCFHKGVAGVASTGGVITFTGVPVDGDFVILTTHAGVAQKYEFNTTGGVAGGAIAVLPGASAAEAATELIAAINATGGYSGNGSTGYTASSGGAGVVNIVRTATGASNETITKSGADITVTASFSGGVTELTPTAAVAAIDAAYIAVDTSNGSNGSAGTAASTCTDMIAKINAVSGPAFLFTATQGAGTTVTLTANTKGTAGNAFTMTDAATNYAVSGATFAGGQAAGSGSITGDVAVAIGASANATATNFFNAVNGAAIDITASNGTPGTCSLQNDLGGTAGNVAITSNASNVTVTGMSGGVDTEDVVLLTDDEVGSNNKVIIENFWFKVNGGTAWNDAASVSLVDTDAAVFATVLKAALTGNAVVIPTTTNVGADWLAGGGAGKGLSLTAASNENTGSNLIVRVQGVIVPA